MDSDESISGSELVYQSNSDGTAEIYVQPVSSLIVVVNWLAALRRDK